MQLTRMTARQAMIAVALAAVGLGLARLANEWMYSTRHGWNTSILPKGRQVIPCEDVHVGEWIIPAGTRCVVVDDPGDDDSAYAGREMIVMLSEGQHRGTVVKIGRTKLRAR